MRILAIAVTFVAVQIAAPALASNCAVPGLARAAAVDFSAAKKKTVKKKKKEKVQYMRSAS